MNTVMEETRTLVIAGRTETFYGYDRLQERGAGLLEAIVRINAGRPAGMTGDADSWNAISELVDTLEEVIDAQEQWLADYDAAIVQDIETFTRKLDTMRKLDRQPGGQDM